jgi:hypothetical protein
MSRKVYGNVYILYMLSLYGLHMYNSKSINTELCIYVYICVYICLYMHVYICLYIYVYI